MAELKSCPFCGGEADIMDNANEQISYRAFGYGTRGYPTWYKCYCKQCGAMGEISRIEKGCEMNTAYERWAKEQAMKNWNTRTPKERGADKPIITCKDCKHLMFSDMYGECNKQLKIVNPSDTCEYAEPKERGGEK